MWLNPLSSVPCILICNKHAPEHPNVLTFQTSCLSLDSQRLSSSNANRAVQTSEMLVGAGSPKEMHP
jgi:hypothetical protein